MKRKLTRNFDKIHHYVDGRRHNGPPSGVTGDLNGVRGDLNDCETTDKDREKGISIDDLII